MWAQLLITIVLVCGIFFVLWKFVGKPLVKKYCVDEKRLETSKLQRKIDELEEKKGVEKELEKEVKVTGDLNEANANLNKLNEELTTLEKGERSEEQQS